MRKVAKFEPGVPFARERGLPRQNDPFAVSTRGRRLSVRRATCRSSVMDPIADIAGLEAVLKRLAPAEGVLSEPLVLLPWCRRVRWLEQRDALIREVM